MKSQELAFAYLLGNPSKEPNFKWKDDDKIEFYFIGQNNEKPAFNGNDALAFIEVIKNEMKTIYTQLDKDGVPHDKTKPLVFGIKVAENYREDTGNLGWFFGCSGEGNGDKKPTRYVMINSSTEEGAPGTFAYGQGDDGKAYVLHEFKEIEKAESALIVDQQ